MEAEVAARGRLGTSAIAGGALALAFLLAALASGRLAWRAWSTLPTNRDGLVARIGTDPDDVAARRALARRDLAAAHPRAARAQLRAALRRQPLASALWLDLAEVALRLGDAAEVRRATARAVRLAPSDPRGCQRAALLVLQAGDAAAAAPYLRCAFAVDPERTGEVLGLAHAVYADAAFVLRTIVPEGRDGAARYLGWAHATGALDAAHVAWRALDERGARPEERLRHVDFLLAHGDVDGALAVWTPALGSHPPGGVVDGDFEGEPVGAGFGWVLLPLDGTRVAIAGGEAAASGRRGLAIEFGGGNPAFGHVQQVVPVTGGRRYRLSALVRADGITSATGPRLRLEPHAACPTLPTVETRELRGTRPWGPVSVEVVTPPDCRAVVVRVARPPSDRLDRDLRGRLWIDDVTLVDLGDAS